MAQEPSGFKLNNMSFICIVQVLRGGRLQLSLMSFTHLRAEMVSQVASICFLAMFSRTPLSLTVGSSGGHVSDRIIEQVE